MTTPTFRRPEPTNETSSNLWRHKYAPTDLSEMALRDEVRDQFEGYIDDGELPCLLLHGTYGVGKTTAAQILARELGYDLKEVNAPAEGRIDFYREDLRDIMRASGSGTAPGFAVLVEEADGASPEAESALIKLIDNHGDDCPVLFTTNNPGEIAGALVSRSEVIDMDQIPVDERERVLRRVLEAEGIEAEDEDVRLFAEHYSAPRDLLREAQNSVRTHGKLHLTSTTDDGKRPAGAYLLRELADQDSEVSIPWDLRPYTAEGHFTLLAGPPKLAGKSTLARHYSVAKATGSSFLGHELPPGKVLWVGPDEHEGHTTREFQNLDAPDTDIYVWYGPAPGIEAVVEEARNRDVGLVVLDTLPRVAGIQNENRNAAWTRWSDRALPLIRQTDAAWLAIHHHRKSGGEGGRAIRGASAIFGFVDVALSLTAVENMANQRALDIVGSRLGYENEEEERRIELTDEGYRVVETSSVAATEEDPVKEVLLEKVLSEEQGLTADEVVEQAKEAGVELGRTAIESRLEELHEEDGEVERTGEGVKGDPYRWKRSDSIASEPGGEEPNE